jgi:hypothetical protein
MSLLRLILVRRSLVEGSGELLQRLAGSWVELLDGTVLYLMNEASPIDLWSIALLRQFEPRSYYGVIWMNSLNLSQCDKLHF